MTTPTAIQKQNFLSRIVPLANNYGTQYGIDPNLIVSQAALESNWGTSSVATSQQNYFGVKTPEAASSGANVYRSYSSLEDSVKGYLNFLVQNPRYENVFGTTGNTAISNLASDGYAQDPGYSSKLSGIANSISPLTSGISSGWDAIGSAFGLGNSDTSIAGDVASVSSSASNLIGEGLAAGELALGAATFNPLLIAQGISGLFGGGSKSSEPSALDKFFAWVKNLFSAHTGARFAAVIVGFILVAVALIYLTGADKTISTVVKTTAKGLGTAAIVAA